jgi:peroxiredoxin
VSAPDASANPTRRSSGWIAVGVGLLLLVYVTLNTLSTHGPGSQGPRVGHRLPPFAAPLVTSSLVGDANVATRRTKGASAGRRPACDVTDPRALNVCTLARRGPVVLAFFTSAGKCVRQLDTIQALAPRFPAMRFAAVAVRGDRGALRALVRRHRWTFPVAQDRDGAVANLYGVAVCPTLVLAARGGRVRETAIGLLSPAALARRVRPLLPTAARSG